MADKKVSKVTKLTPAKIADNTKRITNWLSKGKSTKWVSERVGVNAYQVNKVKKSLVTK